MKYLTVFVSVLLFPISLAAQDRFSVVVNETFDDMTFAVESAIIDRGLVIDNITFVGEMLKRTAADVGAVEVIYNDAVIYNFCSAILSREVMSLDPTNIRYCPYSIYVFTTPDSPDTTTIGHPIYLYPEMEKINDLLRDIIFDAAGF